MAAKAGQKLPPWAVTPGKIDEAVRRIVASAQPLKVIVFGSQSRGEGTSDSDLDIVVVEREVKDRFAEMVRLNRSLRGLLMAVDILVIGERDFEQWAATPGSIYYTASREGRVAYEAA